MGNECQCIKKEKYIKGSARYLKLSENKLITDQMNLCICKIHKNNIIGTGFFCKIPNPDFFNTKPVLITCNHILQKEDIQEGNQINLIYNNNQIELDMKDSREKYSDEKLDITIIEIKKKELNDFIFLEIDEALFKSNNINSLYIDKNIYIIHYPYGQEAAFSIGNISNISNDNINLEHKCATDKGSSGAPILNLENFKVIGIHIGEERFGNFNIGELLITPILNYYNNNRNKENNNQDNEDDEDEDTIKEEDKFEHINKKFEGFDIIKSLSYNDYLVIKKGKNDLFVAQIYKILKNSIMDELIKSYNQVLNLLRHPNILIIEEIKCTKDYFCIIKPYIEHYMTLLDCLEKYEGKYKRTFEENIIQHIMRQLVDVIKYIHGFNIIYRNIRIEKIIVFFENEKDREDLNMIKSTIKIQNFDFSIQLGKNEKAYDTLGTPLLSHPIILKKFNKGIDRYQIGYNEKADIWSLGIICYQLKTGKLPYKAETFNQLVKEVFSKSIVFPDVKTASKEMISFLKSMLQHNANLRLSADELSRHPFITKSYLKKE